MRLAAGAVVLAVGTGAAFAQPYPDAVQCAAYWLGRADYAAATTYLPGEDSAHTIGEAFRLVALRLSDDPVKTEAYIEDQRGLMMLLLDAHIYSNDSQSRDLSERLIARCGELAMTYGETRDLIHPE